MSGHRIRKKLIPTLLVALAAWLVVPKSLIHDLFHTHPQAQAASPVTQVGENPGDCEVEKYDRPLYFTVFRIFSGFLPVRRIAPAMSWSSPGTGISAFSQLLLRAPPVLFGR